MHRLQTGALSNLHRDVETARRARGPRFLVFAGILVAVAALFCFGGIGRLAFNAYRLEIVQYLYRLDSDVDASELHRALDLLDLAAALGHSEAIAERSHLQRAFAGYGDTDPDPLLLWLGLRDAYAARLGNAIPASVWRLALEGGARIEAEEMAITGAPMPNQYVAIAAHEGADFVVLYWEHNRLTTPLVIPQSGQYRLTVFARDCPPPPLRICVAVGGCDVQLRWGRGDYNWRGQSQKVWLPRDLTSLSLSYETPPGNRTQNASIDYIELELVK